MKKTALLLIFFAFILGCKSDKKNETIDENEVATMEDSLTELTGNYVYFDNAAVLQTRNEIYGVVVDDNMMLVENQAKKLKEDSTDMVRVVVKGSVFKNDSVSNTWENWVAVKELIQIRRINQTEDGIILGKNMEETDPEVLAKIKEKELHYERQKQRMSDSERREQEMIEKKKRQMEADKAAKPKMDKEEIEKQKMIEEMEKKKKEDESGKEQ